MPVSNPVGATPANPYLAPQPTPVRKSGGCGCGGGGGHSGGGCGCGEQCSDSCGLERVRFFPRQLLSADDLNAEQHYFREKQRRHNRYLHGWGVVCGCEVRPAPTATRPYQVMICPGYVITPQGDEIMIGAPALFDLATCMVNSDDPCAFARPCPPVTRSTPLRQTIYLSVCYKECEVRPVRVSPGGCGCDDVSCDYSRIRDVYEFACLDCPPPVDTYDCGQLCEGAIMPCPSCPPSNCVVLARIRLRSHYTPGELPPSSSMYTRTGPSAVEYSLDPDNAPVQIDNHSDRKLLYSTSMLQTMAICQCGGERPTTPKAPPPTFAAERSGERVMTVTISDALPQATIHYTTDLSEPTTASQVYGGTPLNFTVTAFSQGKSPTVKAIATAPGYTDSDVATFVVPKP